ncbi:MAG: hypothetical protein INR64_16995, partial [Caulobacteraceae bacterium]|nr:hypothetical protein [Caulobacter sp.]
MGASTWPLAGTLQGAFAWWVGELRDALPQRLRERRRRRADADVILGRDGWTVRDRTGQLLPLAQGDEADIAGAAALIRGRRKSGRVTLVVPLERCFTRRSEIPRRMLGRAAAILASELEIATPFGPGTAHWDWYAAEAGPEPGTVMARQIVLKRRDTEPLAQALARHGIGILTIAVEDAATRRRLPVDLARHGQTVSAEATDLRGSRRLLALTATLVALAIVPAAFSQQSSTLSDLDSALEDATDAVALRPGLARAPLQLMGDALAAKRDWPATAVLNGLAKDLPADSHLDHIFLEKDVATIQGRTASVHNLERAFAASHLFTAGHNTAPAEPGGEGVPFTLRLKVR